MATPAFANDPAAVAFIQREYERLHQQNYFMPDPSYSKQAAHQEAIRRFFVARSQGRV